MYRDKILEKIKVNQGNPNYLMGDLMLEVLEFTSFLKHSYIDITDAYSVGIVIPTKMREQLYDNDPAKIVTEFLTEVAEVVDSNILHKGDTHKIDAFGPSQFMSDWVRNRYTDEHYYTEYAHHISSKEWDMLCTNYSL